MNLLTNKQHKSYENTKNYNVRDHCHYTGEYRGAARSICNLKYSTPKEVTVIFDNGSNYNYGFIIQKLAEKFEGQFNCLGENAQEYITFPVPIEKEVTGVSKNGEEITKLQIAIY